MKKPQEGETCSFEIPLSFCEQLALLQRFAAIWTDRLDLRDGKSAMCTRGWLDSAERRATGKTGTSTNGIGSLAVITKNPPQSFGEFMRGTR